MYVCLNFGERERASSYPIRYPSYFCGLFLKRSTKLWKFHFKFPDKWIGISSKTLPKSFGCWFQRFSIRATRGFRFRLPLVRITKPKKSPRDDLLAPTLKRVDVVTPVPGSKPSDVNKVKRNKNKHLLWRLDADERTSRQRPRAHRRNT